MHEDAEHGSGQQTFGWNIVSPDEASCRTPRGHISPDIFLIKGVSTTNARTQRTKGIVRSDHLPVDLVALMRGTKPNPTEQKNVSRKQRRNPKILSASKDYYNNNQANWVEKIEQALNPEQLEKAYKMHSKMLVSPWSHTRKATPCRLKDFWNTTLEGMAKRRKICTGQH